MEHQRIFERCVRPGDTVFDIGAYIGRSGAMFARLAGKGGAVYCFEPNPASFARLSAFARAGGHTNLRPVHQAVGEVQGRVPLFFGEEERHEQAAAISPAAAVPARLGAAIHGVEVAVTTIDRVCAKLMVPPAFLRIDVEGAEIQVLRGGRATISRYLPSMLIETDDVAGVRAELAPLGYGLFAADVFVFDGAGMICSEQPRMRNRLITLERSDDADTRNCLFNLLALHRRSRGLMEGVATVPFARRHEFLRAPQVSRAQTVKAWLRRQLPDDLVWRVKRIRDRLLRTPGNNRGRL